MQIDKKQHNLGITDPEDLAGAVARLEALVAQLGKTANNSETPGKSLTSIYPRTVAEAVSRYLADVDQRKLAPDWKRSVRRILQRFATAFGDVQVCALRADQVEKWVETRPWSSSYQNNAVGVISGFLKSEGVSLRLRKPPKESRGADTCLTDEQFAAVIHDLTAPGRPRKLGDIAQLLRLLRETGARPGEVVGLTVEEMDWDAAMIRLRKHKTRRHTGKDRPIYCNSAAMSILAAQRDKWGSGLLFRTRNGNPYSVKYLTDVLVPCSKRVGFRVIAYGLGRHGFATNALANGVPEALVAELLGHRGTAMLTHHYSHLGTRAAALKQAAEMASRPNFSAQRAHEKCD